MIKIDSTRQLLDLQKLLKDTLFYIVNRGSRFHQIHLFSTSFQNSYILAQSLFAKCILDTPSECHPAWATGTHRESLYSLETLQPHHSL